MESNLLLEQQRVREMMKFIQLEIAKLEGDTTKLKEDVIHIRKHFWDEVRVSTDSFDDYMETIIGLRQEAQALAIRQSTHRHAGERLDALKRLQHIPYFGRIDFKEEGTDQTEPIYIGVATLTDPSGEDFLIYDWRAPIASVYYDYEPGPAMYRIPDGGNIQGELEKKWQYIIRDGELVSMFDAGVTIGDEVLQQVLGQGTDKQMQSIVATIQQEQNRAIRHDKGKLLIVMGAAGSGKTSVAMQRIAYLLYKYRDTVTSDQILLFSPNPMFSSYVSNVLPELGEENMQQATFQEYMRDRIDEQFKMETPFAQLEYVLTKRDSPNYPVRIAGMKWKASVACFDYIQEAITRFGTEGMAFRDIRFRGRILVNKDQIAKRFYSQESTMRFANRLEEVRLWLESKLKGFAQNERQKPWVQEAVDSLDNAQFYEAQVALAKQKGLRGDDVSDVEVDEKDLARLIVQRRMNPVVKAVHSYDFVDWTGLYCQLFDVQSNGNVTLPKEWKAIGAMTKKTLDRGHIFYEDATPFIYLKEAMLGFASNRSIKHVVVDEAQDYSPFQFAFLKQLFPSARMTVLGDFNQSIFSHSQDSNEFSLLTTLFGEEETSSIHLAKSYRSTKPIVEFTKRLVPNSYPIVPFERDGKEPVVEEFTSKTTLHAKIVAKVNQWKEQGFTSIAIICQSAKERKDVSSVLGETMDHVLITTKSNEYEEGVVVIPSYLAKGIEFEAVIVYNASDKVYGDESLRRTLYTVCTRAMHELIVFSLGPKSHFLEE
ncbi:RNA polymerase recycling motor HelD [Paenisporosarcina cavernae]|uniref:Helicase n=1 Tax=Paenisporosarcina cavernae TaxID=2320858 RepID=A0A385YPC0_9BACL|nr:RNA polymerase recycling motor HelD [Paenisporosarcina cavernae]AYC28436.1 helicase [Paenisporosarcina cavernae]